MIILWEKEAKNNQGRTTSMPMKPISLFILFSLIVCFVLSSCIKVQNPYNGLAPGIWRATLIVDTEKAHLDQLQKEYRYDQKFEFEELTEGELPFLMNVIYPNPDSFYIEIINGEERIQVTDIVFGRDLSTAKDTIRIDFPLWQTHIEAIIEENIMEGRWVVNYKENYEVPFIAQYGKNYRFSPLQKEPIMDVSGKWNAVFSPESESPSIKLGEFIQEGNHIKGTFRSATGDSRFLEGTIQNDKIYLSTFDGTHAYLYEAKVFPDSTIYGLYRSGNSYITTWQATKTTGDATIKNEIKISNSEDVDFSFVNTAGNVISLSDEKYKDKIVLIQILGSWCPNCLDETKFILEYLATNPTDDIEVIGLAFERYADTTKSLKTIKRYKERLKIPYELLLAGTSTSKTAAAESLPFLDELIAYPTMIILDHNHDIHYVHNGFDGPATSAYSHFKESFELMMEDLQNKTP